MVGIWSLLALALGLFTAIECTIPSPIMDLSMEDLSCDVLDGTPQDFITPPNTNGVRLATGHDGQGLCLFNDYPGEESISDPAREYVSQSQAFSDDCAQTQDCPNGYTLVAWTKLRYRENCGYGCNTIIGYSGSFGQEWGIMTTFPHFHFIYYTVRTEHAFVIYSCSLSDQKTYDDFFVWNHWALTADGPPGSGTNYTMYMNGIPISGCFNYGTDSDFSGLGDASAASAYIGCTDLSDGTICTCGFHGMIDDVKMYDEHLTEAQINTFIPTPA